MAPACNLLRDLQSFADMKDDFTFKPVDSNNWKDLEKLFESKGGPQYCWCMVWRNIIKGGDRSSREDKKESLKNYVRQKLPVGILCYADEEPVGWCSIAPRDSYRNLGGDESLKNVWSLVCFFIKKEFRKMGVSQKLIRAALQYAKKNGAKYVEAYPVDPDSPSYRFMGFRETFEKLGFQFIHKAGQRRNVMSTKL